MAFSSLVDEILSEYYRLEPAHATEIGYHAHDGRWPDLTEAGRAERAAWAADAVARLEAVEEGGLSRDEAVDRRVLIQNLEAMRFGEEVLREGSWNPLGYVYLFGGGLFALLAREFAPLPDRLRSAASRMRGLPSAIDAARATLEEAMATGDPRPVSRFHAEKAAERMIGVTDLCQTAVKEAEGVGDPGLLDEVRAAAQEAEAAVDGFTTWLREQLLPRATGDFRLGPELYATKFRHALKSEVAPEELERRARAEYDRVRAEMLRLARELWPAWMGDLDAIAAEHPAEEELLDFCREENRRIEAFVRERDLIGLTDEPLQIVWTPKFLRAFGGAMLIAPGPLDRHLDAFFAITPMP
jgi:uncharacterized protein (DUF885 family)